MTSALERGHSSPQTSPVLSKPGGGSPPPCVAHSACGHLSSLRPADTHHACSVRNSLAFKHTQARPAGKAPLGLSSSQPARPFFSPDSELRIGRLLSISGFYRHRATEMPGEAWRPPEQKRAASFLCHSCLVALRAGSLGQGLPGTGVCGAGRGPNNGTPPKLGPCSVLSSPALLLEESVHLWALTFTSILVALGLYLT